MDWIPDEHRGPSASRPSLSRASTATSTTLMVNIPPSSDDGSANPDHAHLPIPAAIPAGPLRVTSLSVTDWRPQYPRIGQFAITPSEEVVAATPNGLVCFKRVQDHPSKPWSEPRPFPPTTARLNASTVTGLVLHQGEKGDLRLYCVAAGGLHAFSRSGDLSSSFVVEPYPPFAGSTVSGTPAVTSIKGGSEYPNCQWCIIVPSPSGGILYTSTFASSTGYSYDPPRQSWEPSNQLAAHLGIISAVSVAATHARKPGGYGMYPDINTDIVAVCIASSRLHSVEGPFQQPSCSSKNTWQGPKSIKIQHPGEVTGNPVLLGSENPGGDYQLDLLVPSAEGGVFHFIRTVNTPDEWHMIGRINFPTGIPIASSLACGRVSDGNYSHRSKFRAFVQCGGRLYLIETTENAQPWVGSQLYPINGPGPFLH